MASAVERSVPALEPCLDFRQDSLLTPCAIPILAEILDRSRGFAKAKEIEGGGFGQSERFLLRSCQLLRFYVHSKVPHRVSDPVPSRVTLPLGRAG